MTREIRNPVNFLSLLPLMRAEKEFVHCLAEGRPCVIGDGELPKKAIESGQGANVVRGEVIRFFAFGGNDDYSTLGPVIRLQGAWICGEKPLNLMYADIPYALQFVNCHFAIGVEMLRTECVALCLDESCLAYGLMASGLTTKGNVHMCGLSGKGEVLLMNASIGGNLSCKGGNMHNPSGYALIADNLVTKGSVSLSENFSAEGGVRLSGANIGGNLVCKDGKFVKLKRYGFVANGITVEGSVFLNGCFSAEGEVSFLGADIGGDLNCQGGTFHNPRLKVKIGGYALTMNGVTTRGHVFLSNGFSAKGKVRMRGANIGGNLDCAGGEFINPNRYALNAERVKTGGHVFLNKYVNGGNQPFSADGRVRFANADVGRNFNCKGGQFYQPGKKSAIAAAGLRTRGAVFLSDGFSVGGNIDLNVAQIGGNFVCKVCKKSGPAASIIDLSATKAAAVDDDPESWKPFEFILDGFTYDTFYGDPPTGLRSRLKWLKRRPTERHLKDGERVDFPFSPLPYEQAAKVLFGMGYDNEAREILLEKESIRMRQEEASDDIFSPVSHDAVANILFAMGRNRDAREILLKRERLLTERGEFPPRWRWGRKIWGALAGYGYRPWWRTFHISCWIIVFGSVFFGLGEQAGRIVPHQPAALVSMKYQYGRIPAETPDETVARKFSGYPEFNPILFSVDIFVPLLNLHQEPFWYPAPDGGHQHWWRNTEDGEFPWGVLLEGWYWFQIMAGGVLTSFFLLSIAQLVRPRQSSSEKD